MSQPTFQIKVTAPNHVIPPKLCLLAVIVAAMACAGPVAAQPTLFARYDWADAAKDVAGVTVQHDGQLEAEASVVAGKLVLNGWDGVVFNEMPELTGAKQLMLRFEDVTIDPSAPEGSDPAYHYSALAGCGSNWWVGVMHELRPNAQTWMQFVGYGSASSWAIVSDNAAVPHFDSIEFMVDGTAPLGQRYGIRWNEGPWVLSGQGNDQWSDWPLNEQFRINDGRPSDWEPIYATLGTVSLYSDVVVPEPASGLLLLAAAWLGLSRRRRTFLNFQNNHCVHRLY